MLLSVAAASVASVRAVTASGRPARASVVLLEPEGYPFAAALADAARLVHYSLESLGIQSRQVVNTLDPAGLNIILGYHLLGDPGLLAPFRYIVYQLEQVVDRPDWFTPARLEILRRAEAVWDYAEENVRALSERGVAARLVPLGFHERLQSIPRQAQPTDVLFFGSTNPRRQAVLEELARDCNVEALFGVFGEERDRKISEAKIVLNIHFYPAQIMEQARVAYLLNNRVFVVTEDSPRNPYAGGVVAAAYERLAETCRAYLARPEDRYRVARAGYELLRGRPMVEYVRAALETPPALGNV